MPHATEIISLLFLYIHWQLNFIPKRRDVASDNCCHTKHAEIGGIKPLIVEDILWQRGELGPATSVNKSPELTFIEPYFEPSPVQDTNGG